MTARTARRGKPGRRDRRTFFERRRGTLITAIGVLGLVLLGGFIFFSASQPAYACDTLLSPGPSEPPPSVETTSGASAPAGVSPAASGSPEPSESAAAGSASPSASASPEASASAPPEATPTQRLGFVAEDMGREHVRRGATNRYRYCPPASGNHYNLQGEGPIRRAFYGPEGERDPGGWLHNLEHGYVVGVFSCDQKFGGCPSEEELAEMRAFFEEAPTTEGAQACQLPNKVLVVRFDQMATQFAVLGWDRALLLDTFDRQQAAAFAAQWIDGPSTPERGAC